MVLSSEGGPGCALEGGWESGPGDGPESFSRVGAESVPRDGPEDGYEEGSDGGSEGGSISSILSMASVISSLSMVSGLWSTGVQP